MKNLRLAWSRTILAESGEGFFSSPLRWGHPIAETLEFLLSPKKGPPLRTGIGTLPLGELCQLAILKTLAGEDGEALARKLLPLCSFPTLWSSEKTYNRDETKISIDLLLRAFGKKTSGLEIQNPYFRALAAVLPRWEEVPGALDSSLAEICGQMAFVALGEGVSLGAFRSGGVEVPAFGPQVHPLNNPQLFGISRQIPDIRWSSVFAKKEVWFETKREASRLNFRFFGLTPECPISFVFYVKAEQAKIDQDVFLPKNLRIFYGEAKKVTFLGKEKSHLSIENILPGKMELIPLAGEGCFWGSDFLLAFKVPDHEGQISFQIF